MNERFVKRIKVLKLMLLIRWATIIVYFKKALDVIIEIAGRKLIAIERKSKTLKISLYCFETTILIS